MVAPASVCMSGILLERLRREGGREMGGPGGAAAAAANRDAAGFSQGRKKTAHGNDSGTKTSANVVSVGQKQQLCNRFQLRAGPEVRVAVRFRDSFTQTARLKCNFNVRAVRPSAQKSSLSRDVIVKNVL